MPRSIISNDRSGELVQNGSWHGSPRLVWLLGVFPSLAVATSAFRGLALGLTILLTLMAASGCISVARGWVRPGTRMLVFLLITGSLAAAFELALNAYFHELYAALGIYLPLIAISCAMIGYIDFLGFKRREAASILNALKICGSIALVLSILGGLRELLSYGTLLSQAELLFGSAAGDLTVTLIEDHQGLLLAGLPPGAFIVLGSLTALKNLIDRRHG